MADDLYAPGNKLSIHSQQYRDNYTRTFVGYPEMNHYIRNMLIAFVDSGDLKKLLIFFKNTCKFDSDYAGFLYREALNGNLFKDL